MNQLPAGWVLQPLSSLVVDARKLMTPEKGTTYELWSVPSFADGAPEIVDGQTIKSAKLEVREDDVLISKINPRINRVWQVRESNLPQIGSSEWLVGRIKEKGVLSPKYLTLYLSSPAFREWITGATEGVTGSHTRAKSPQMLKQLIPFPSLDVQMRIVETLEDHLSRLDKALAETLAATVQVKTAISSFLHELDPANASAKGWALTSLGQHTEKPQYGWTTSGANSGSSKLLRTTDIIREQLDWNTVPFCSSAPDQLDKFRLQDGDIVISRTGAGVGSSRLINDPPADTVFASYLIRVRPKATVLPQFLSLFLKSPGYWRQVSEQKAGSAISNINVPKIQDLKMAIPSVEEQQTLVNRFAEFEETMLRTRSAIFKVENQTEKLRRSLLHAGFTGQLTNEDSNV